MYSCSPPLDQVPIFLSHLQEAKDILRESQNSDSSLSPTLKAIKALAKGLELRAILLEARIRGLVSLHDNIVTNTGKKEGKALLDKVIARRQHTGVYFITDCILAEIIVQVHLWDGDSYFDDYFDEYSTPMGYKPGVASLYKVAAYINALSYFPSKNHGLLFAPLVKLIRKIDFEKAFSSRITQEWWNSALYTVATYMLEFKNREGTALVEDLHQTLDPILWETMESLNDVFTQPTDDIYDNDLAQHDESSYYQSDSGEEDD